MKHPVTAALALALGIALAAGAQAHATVQQGKMPQQLRTTQHTTNVRAMHRVRHVRNIRMDRVKRIAKLNEQKRDRLSGQHTTTGVGSSMPPANAQNGNLTIPPSPQAPSTAGASTPQK